MAHEEIQPLQSEADAAVIEKPESQQPDNKIVDTEGTSPPEDTAAQHGTRDLESLEHVRSGPAYSVFDTPQKNLIVFMVAFGGFFSPLSANIYFPALNALSRDLNVSSELINLTLTSYMIFQGIAPTIFGDLADMTGRRPVYILGFFIYIGANIGLALQNNYVALIVLRCLQSTGSSGTVALGSGVVADVASSGERGKYIGRQPLVMIDGSSADVVQVLHNSVQWQPLL